ncbi:MAG: TolC family protein [Acidithiobacillus sp.]|nr:TolC family protein [Acidithiobacillus sp.]
MIIKKNSNLSLPQKKWAIHIQDAVVLGLSMLFLSACAPTIHAPSLTSVHAPHMEKTVQMLEANHPLPTGSWPQQDWWRTLKIGPLDQIMSAAIAHSPVLAASQSELEWASAMTKLRGAALGPQLTGTASITPLQFSGNGPLGALGLGNKFYDSGDIGFGFRQSLDFWGKRKDRVQAALGKERADAARLADTRRLLTGAIAYQYLDWCLASQQFALTKRLLVIAQNREHLLQTRQKLGLGSDISVTSEQVDIHQLQSSVEKWAGRADDARIALANLANLDPDSIAIDPTYPRENVLPTLPANLRLDLLAHRPDVQAARDMALARISETKAAQAEFYPDISFSTLLDFNSASMATLLNPASFAYAFGPAIHLPFFTSGALHAQLRAAEAKQSEAVAIYEQTILEATRQVLTALSSWNSSSDQWSAQQKASRSAQQREKLVARRRELGVDNQLTVLVTKAQMIEQQKQETLLYYHRLQAWVDLETALGGGYGQ